MTMKSAVFLLNEGGSQVTELSPRVRNSPIIQPQEFSVTEPQNNILFTLLYLCYLKKALV